VVIEDISGFHSVHVNFFFGKKVVESPEKFLEHQNQQTKTNAMHSVLVGVIVAVSCQMTNYYCKPTSRSSCKPERHVKTRICFPDVLVLAKSRTRVLSFGPIETLNFRNSESEPNNMSGRRVGSTSAII
jgi:hypothetical protein